MKNCEESNPINLLWTGGWDSTFRLLQAILLENKQVQPYYIVDHKRKSTQYEFRAMEGIKKALFARHPEAERLLLPTIIGYRNQIQPNMEITRRWEPLGHGIRLGRQFEWLPLFAEQNNLNDLELCLEKKLPYSNFDKLLRAETIGEGHMCRTMATIEHGSFRIFKYFRFPVYHIEKIEMEKIAKKNGFLDILKNIWFCHSPNKDGKPCEVCHPCQLARKAGYSHGLPKTNFFRDKYLLFVYKAPKAWEKVCVKTKRIIPKLIWITKSINKSISKNQNHLVKRPHHQ